MVHFYSVTLQKTTGIVQAVHGNFSQGRTQEIVTSKGKLLELYRLDDNGKLHCVVSTEVFGFVRQIAAFRLLGAQRDYLVVGSDAGRIVILEFNATKSCFEKVHQETYGKTGIRRIVPGQYVAVDPRGRAIMIGAVERSKFIYVMNRDSNAKLTISSPLEAHKSHQICFAVTGVDVGFENPVFASIECNYEECDRRSKSRQTSKGADSDTSTNTGAEMGASTGADAGEEVPEFRPPKKGLAFWEMDLGLNHVIKKCTMPIEQSAHAVIPVPAGTGVYDGPSGVVVCCENFLVYKKPEHPDVSCAIPRRLEMGQEKGLMVVSHATHRLKNFFFFLIQSEYGDLYKVELTHSEGTVSELVCRYFDTIPVTSSLCVLKTGYLFAAAEFGNHQLYQFTGVGNDETDPLCTSLHPHGATAIVAFKPHGLRNLQLVDELYSLSPMTDMKVIDALSEGHPQIYALCGRGPRSTLRILQHGIAVDEMADNDLPAKPSAVWTLKLKLTDEFDSYIIVSFADSTLILSIGDTVEEVTDSPFATDVGTLHVDTLTDNSHVQVHSAGLRHIQKEGRVSEWRVPSGGKRVVCASSNKRQVAIALCGGDVICFELDESRVLNEVQRRDLGHEVTCLSVQPIPDGRSKASFLAVGGLDNTVRILSLERDKGLRQHAIHAFSNNAHPESCCLIQMRGLGSTETGTALCLCVGLETGIFVRSFVDFTSGQLSENRSRFIGQKAVNVRPAAVGVGPARIPAILALSAKPWLCYSFQGKFTSVPLHYDQLEFASPFSSEQCPDGFVAISGKSLRIFQCCRLGEVFSQTHIPLSYTPRKFTPLPPSTPPAPGQFNGVVSYTTDISGEVNLGGPNGLTEPQVCMLAIVEADHNAYDEATKREIRDALKKITLHDEEEDDDDEDEDEDAMKAEDDDEAEAAAAVRKKLKKKTTAIKKEETATGEDEEVTEEQIGTFKAGKGKWGSCIRIVNPATGKTLHKLELELDEAAVSCTVCRFLEFDAPCLIVGTVHGMTLCPRRVPMASIKVYAYDANYNLTLLHSTPVEELPQALCPWNGRLLASVGARIRVYALGKKKLLKKCEYKNIPETVVWMRVVGDRIYVADIREGMHVLKYRERENVLYVLADESCPMWVTSAETLDYHTIITADKFDSISVGRVPSEARADESGDGMGMKLKGDTAYLTGQCHKLEQLCHFHVGETVMALQKAKLTPGGSEVVIMATILGSIGALVPLATKDELSFLQHLEMIMRNESPPLCGRDHIMFRSYYFPVKNVVDGDLCEQYTTLSQDKQREIASELDKSPNEVLKKLEDLRTRIL